LISGIRARDLVVAAPLAAAALSGAFAATAGRRADDAFLLRQDNPRRVTVSSVERLIRTAPDPRPPHASRATSSQCQPGSLRGLRNPWRCTVAYRSGSAARFVVTVHTDGSYLAHYAGGPATARGCCLALPSPD
jgi:hypothetical protein